MAACATLLRAQRRLRLHIERRDTVRDVQTLTLFVGNNRLQLQQFGVEPKGTLAATSAAAIAKEFKTSTLPATQSAASAISGRRAGVGFPVQVRLS